MATTKNHKITKTLKKAIDYAMGDKVGDKVKDDIKDNIVYVIDNKTGKVIYPTIYSTQNCLINKHPYETFMRTIENFGADELRHGNNHSKDHAPVLAWHFYQNFEGHVNSALANEIGRKLTKEMFPDFAVVIATHTNTENTHNHIIVCAWDKYGHKWNQCNRAYQKLREVSDRLCEEYGLSVLRDTKQQHIIKYKDKNGNLHYYEPTDRKNNLIAQRNKGEISTDDVRSYRNYMPYEQIENKKATNIEIIKQDIDHLLPVATSYEHLLQMLRQIGYVINDKKKNGDWLKHVSFQPPLADKATRDYKLSNDGFYLRKNLERVIDKLVADQVTSKEQEQTATIKNKEPVKQQMNMPPFFDKYVYGETIITDIDEDIRTVKEKDGTFSVVERGEIEKTIIRDVRVKDSELRLINTTELEKLIREQKQKEKKPPKKREEILLYQINESFHALRFMEKESLYSQNQINTIMASTWEKYNECMKNLETLEMVVIRLEKVLQVSQKVEIIESRIERMKGNLDYEQNELAGDINQLKLYRETIVKFKLNNPESAAKLIAQVQHSREKIGQLQNILAIHKERLSEYDHCISVLSRIDHESGRDNSEIMKEYQNIRKQGEEEAKQTEAKRNKKKAAER